MTKISSLVELLGASVDQANDLLTIVDMSETGAARNKKIKVTQLMGLITDIVGLLDLKGSTDCSANPNYPAAVKGDTYRVSVAGKIGGASGKVVEVSDLYYALADNAGGTEAAVGTSWDVIQGNVTGSTIAELDDIPDVNAPSPTAGDVLTWDDTPGEWVASAPTGGSNALDDLTDVDAPTPADGDVLTFDSGSGDWVPSAPGSGTFSGALVKRATDQTTANYTAETAIPFDAETYDTDSFHDTATNNTRLTIPSGVTRVRLWGHVRITSTADADYHILSITKNGSLTYDGAGRASAVQTGTNSDITVQTGIIDVSPGDYFELKLLIEADSSVTIAADRTSFGIEVIENIVPRSTSFRGALVTKAADQTTADYTAGPAIAWDSESYDTDTIHDNVTNNSRLSVPSGVTKVRLTGQAHLSNVTANESVTLRLGKNGGVDNFTGAASVSSDINGTTRRMAIESPILTVAGGTDYFQLFLTTPVDNSITVEADSSWFAMEIIE